MISSSRLAQSIQEMHDTSRRSKDDQNMIIRAMLRKAFKSFSVEVLAMWFAFWDRRVQWYVKVILLLGIVYVVSPYDLIKDSLPFWGQIDDIIVLRISYVVSRMIIDPVVLDDCREWATKFLDTGRANKLRFVAGLLLVWGLVLFLFARYLVHKIGKL